MKSFMYIWRTGDCRQSGRPPSIADLIAVKQETLFVFKYKNHKFYRLESDGNSFAWIKVKAASRLVDEDGGITHL